MMSDIVSHLEAAVWLDGRNRRSGGTGVQSYARALGETLSDLGISSRVLQEQDGGRSSGVAGFLRAVSGQMPPLRPDIEGDPVGGNLYRIAHIRYRLLRRLSVIRSPACLAPPRIMHWTSPLPLRLRGARNVVTIHDLIPLTHPELTGVDPSRYACLIRELLDSADGIATVSDVVRQEIISRFGISPDRIDNLYQPVCCDDALRAEIARAQPVVPDGGFLFVGRVEARKNIDRLLRAHALSHSTRPLALVGPDGDDHPDCSARGPSSRILRIPWCDRLRLLRTIAGAHAVLFPSLAEGFGLPVIEAMALDTPVLTSRDGATEEIAGDAALLVDPCDEKDIAAGISALDNPVTGPALRQSLKERGRLRAQFFSRESFSTRLRSFYRRVDPDFPF